MSRATGPTIIITPAGTVGTWRDIWAFRELLAFTVWRDLRVRYRQTALGIAWAVIQPFTTMVVFSLFFGRLAGIQSGDVPYPVFSYAGLVPWTYLSTAVTQGAASLVGSQHLIAKVYFPRLIVPIAAILVPLVDAAIALVLLAGIMAWYGVAPGIGVVWLPVFIVVAVLTAAAASVWLAALNVRYRDIRFVVPFAIQFWLFVTPIAYPTSLVPDRWRALYALNPMATVVDGVRWGLTGAPPPSPAMMAASGIALVLALWTGLRYFRRTERIVADVL